MSEPTKTRILVTGGSGFIGSYVVDRLLSDGYQPLVTTFNLTTERSSSLSSKIELFKLDLTDAQQVEDLIQNYKPQVVFHLAGVTGHADRTGKIYDSVNYEGTLNLLRPLEEFGVGRVIMIGSAAEYGNQTIPFREGLSAHPVSPYATSKAKAGNAALKMHAASGFPVTILRVFTAYGYGQPHKMFLSQAITHAILNRRFKMSDGMQARDFVFVEDVVAAITASMAAVNAAGQIINIGGGQGVRLRDVAQKIWEICGADTDLLDIGSLEKSGDDSFDTEADISLAGKILGWKPGPGILSNSDNYSRLRQTIQKMKNELATRADK